MRDVVIPFLDDNKKIKLLPSKHEKKLAVLRYLADKFEYGQVYREKEVNAIIEAWHTFSDFHLLRRELIDHKLLARTWNGSKYWREEEPEERP
jgi:hypothetical protein